MIGNYKNLAHFIYGWKRQDIKTQNRMIDWLLLFAYYKAHRQQPIIDDRTILRHPVDEEICRCIASGITLDEFIADWMFSHGDSSVVMLRRRWFKIAHLLQVYQMYSQPILPISMED
jgi:hypothetical protein